MSWAQEQRRLFIAETLERDGKLNRSDIEKKFGVSTALASLDLRRFREMHPGKMAYDASLKIFTATKDEAMTHVFEGKPDARQSDDVAMPTSRFRPKYRALTPDEKALHDEIKAQAVVLETLFEKVKPGRYRALGLTALEEAVMWTVKELTA